MPIRNSRKTAKLEEKQKTARANYLRKKTMPERINLYFIYKAIESDDETVKTTEYCSSKIKGVRFF